jgi:hypothetical protein
LGYVALKWKAVPCDVGTPCSGTGKLEQIADELGYTAKWGEKEATAYVWWQCRNTLLPNHGIETEKDGETIRLMLPPGKQVADALRS